MIAGIDDEKINGCGRRRLDGRLRLSQPAAKRDRRYRERESERVYGTVPFVVSIIPFTAAVRAPAQALAAFRRS